jgi:hypothetical protein
MPICPTLAVRRWRLLVLLGLTLAPFLPASNLLFYVGTFIGERLMYMPSIGYCILMGEGLVTVLVRTEAVKMIKMVKIGKRRYSLSSSRVFV